MISGYTRLIGSEQNYNKTEGHEMEIDTKHNTFPNTLFIHHSHHIEVPNKPFMLTPLIEQANTVVILISA